MRTDRSYPPATNSLPVGDQSTEVTAETKSWWTHVAPLENILASNEYRFVSSEAATRLKGSIGFQAAAVARVCMTSLRTGVEALTSNSTTARSAPPAATSSEGSAGLKRTALTPSAPHSRRWTGADLERAASQTATPAPPPVAKTPRERGWWSTEERPPPPPSNSATAAASTTELDAASPPPRTAEENSDVDTTEPGSGGAKGKRNILMAPSAEHETSASPLADTDTPWIAAAWPTSLLSLRLPAKSHTDSVPSAHPDTSALSLAGDRASAVTPSSWPKAATKGLAKTRSSFTALRARLASVARSKGRRAGSRLRWTLRRSPERSRVASSAERTMVLTFIFFPFLKTKRGRTTKSEATATTKKRRRRRRRVEQGARMCVFFLSL